MSDMKKQDGAQAAQAAAPVENNAQSEKPATTDQAVKKEKSAKKAKDNKPGVMERFKRWLREMRSELKKVSWPTAKDTVRNMGTVIACVLVVGVFIWGFDWLTHAVVQALLNLFA